MQLHLGYDGAQFNIAVITSFITFPLSTVCQLIYATGENLAMIVPHYPVIERWAKSHGADTVEIFGRPGWESVMRDMGFKKHAVVLYKRIEADEKTEASSLN